MVFGAKPTKDVAESVPPINGIVFSKNEKRYSVLIFET